MKIQRTTIIDHPPQDVFDYVCDPLNDPEWCPWVLEARQVRGDGPHVGAEYEQLHNPGPGSPTRLHVEILDIDEPRSTTIRSTDELAVFEVTMDLEALPDGRTRITQTDLIRTQGVKKLLLPVLWGGVHVGIRNQFRELQRELVAQPPERA